MSMNYSPVLPFDLGFKQKYKLSASQTTLFSYLTLLPNWAKDINSDEYYLIVTSKIISDLNMGLKTVENGLKTLEDLDLIQRGSSKVSEWNNNKNYRTVHITTKGKAYNHHYAKSENEDLAKEWERKYEDVVKLNQQLTTENKELKATPKPENKIDDFESFRKKITKEFGESCKPICDCVINSDKWAEDTQFWINSYKKLAIKTPKGDFKQISNPEQITNFWKWLYQNKHRCGDLKKIKNEEKKVEIIPTIYHLLPFVGLMILLDGETFIINMLKAVSGGVKIVLQNAKTLQLTNEQIVDVNILTNWIVKHRQEFQEWELQKEIKKMQDLIGSMIFFQDKKLEIMGFREEENFKISILAKDENQHTQTITDNQRKNNPKIKFSPNRAREFIVINRE